MPDLPALPATLAPPGTRAGQRAAAVAVLAAELGSRFTPEDVVDWLHAPHPCLGCRAPLDLLPHRLEACRQVARLERFMRQG